MSDAGLRQRQQTNHDDQLGEIYPTMLNELNCTFGVSFSRFHCCGRHGIAPSVGNDLKSFDLKS